MFVSNYQIDMHASSSNSKTPRKKTTIPPSDSPAEVLQSSQAPVSQNPPLVITSKRNKGKGKAKEVITEEEPENPIELPLVEIDDHVQSVPVKIGPPVLRRSSRRKLELIEQPQEQIVVEKQSELPIEPSPMEVDDDIPIIEIKTGVHAPRSSSRNKITIVEQSH